MADYRHLPIFKAAMDQVVHLAQAVRHYPQNHKYTLDSELGHISQHLCCWMARTSKATAAGHYAALNQLVLSQRTPAFTKLKPNTKL